MLKPIYLSQKILSRRPQSALILQGKSLPAPIGLPAPPCPSFQGRKEELAILSRHIQSSCRPLLLSGAEGSGRASLLRRLVTYLSATGSPFDFGWVSYQDSLRNTVCALPLNGWEAENASGQPKPPEQVYPQKIAQMAGHSGGFVLCIDHAVLPLLPDDMEVLQHLAHHHIRVLMTVADALPSSEVDVFSLPPLSADELYSIALSLWAEAKASPLSQQLRQLCSAAGCTPLFVSLLVYALRENARNAASLLDSFSSSWDGTSPSDFLEKFFAVFPLSRAEQKTLQLLSFLPAEGMDTELFLALVGRQHTRTLNHLRALGIVEDGQGENSVCLPLLLAEFAAQHFTLIDDATSPYLQNLCLLYGNLMPYQTQALEQASQFCRAAVRRVSDSDVLLALYACIEAAEAHLGNLHRALDYALREVQLWKQSPQMDKKAVSALYDRLSGFYGRLGNWEEAVECRRLSLEFAEKNIASDHRALAEEYERISDMCFGLNQPQKALEYAQKALSIRERFFAPKDSRLAEVFDRIAAIYCTLNDPDNELLYAQKALTLRQSTLSPQNPHLAASWYAVGTAYTHQNHLQKARECHETALSLRRTLFTTDHPDLAASCHATGTICGLLGYYSNAQALQTEALQMRQRILPPDHPDLAQSFNDLGYTYFILKDYATALDYLQRALSIRENFLPDDHPDLIGSHKNIAVTYMAQGDIYTAANHWFAASEIENRRKKKR